MTLQNVIFVILVSQSQIMSLLVRAPLWFVYVFSPPQRLNRAHGAEKNKFHKGERFIEKSRLWRGAGV